MSRFHVTPLLLVVALLAVAPLAQAKEPVVLVLAYTQNDKTVSQDIRGDVGRFPLKETKAAQFQWLLRPGERVKAAVRPADKFIELAHAADGNSQTLCVVEVRYFPDGPRWKPAFRIDETPLVARDPATGQWRPVGYVDGNPALLQLIGPSLPNAEGYYSELRFGLTTGPVAIHAYTVR
ncbi:MAG: hypothetical protein A2150_00955 [Candidatus Muproteobacteria bacterium RBG_16_64_11]|uniref:Uncharacterized protein n=1 Tax=Candidatus Muproteobacteria bacterium RBG_16_64_11 TaxID=1817758 RepID=A0A1F6TBM8_9PROT|nr:MAG: hypothetical protein A2150_00955 [Candidatus Muproteobacteria bacterium RBG_16_64_11]